jgi:hypothetical protein
MEGVFTLAIFFHPKFFLNTREGDVGQGVPAAEHARGEGRHIFDGSLNGFSKGF